MLPTAPKALSPRRFVHLILSVVRSCAVLPEGTAWDAAAYRRADRAVEAGAAVLTWPWTDRDGRQVLEEVVIGHKVRVRDKTDDEIVLEREVIRRCAVVGEKLPANRGAGVEQGRPSREDVLWAAATA